MLLEQNEVWFPNQWEPSQSPAAQHAKASTARASTLYLLRSKPHPGSNRTPSWAAFAEESERQGEFADLMNIARR
jgi:hypothetical protein